MCKDCKEEKKLRTGFFSTPLSPLSRGLRDYEKHLIDLMTQSLQLYNLKWIILLLFSPSFRSPKCWSAIYCTGEGKPLFHLHSPSHVTVPSTLQSKINYNAAVLPVVQVSKMLICNILLVQVSHSFICILHLMILSVKLDKLKFILLLLFSLSFRSPKCWSAVQYSTEAGRPTRDESVNYPT